MINNNMMIEYATINFKQSYVKKGVYLYGDITFYHLARRTDDRRCLQSTREEEKK